MTKDDATPTLPRTLVEALPVSLKIMEHVHAIEKLTPMLIKQLESSKKKGPIALARAFVVFHRLREALCSDEKNRFKPISRLFEDYKVKIVPETLEQSGLDNVPLSEGFRVGVNHAWRASIIKDNKRAAYEWMRDNYPDIISETINASTLAALAKDLSEKNQELPADLFNAAQVPGASVTRT